MLACLVGLLSQLLGAGVRLAFAQKLRLWSIQCWQAQLQYNSHPYFLPQLQLEGVGEIVYHLELMAGLFLEILREANHLDEEQERPFSTLEMGSFYYYF